MYASYMSLCERMNVSSTFLLILSTIRAKVWKARTTSTLFNVKQYCSDMETLLHIMWRRYEEGRQVEHITQGATQVDF
ncbi:unnamed protein product [Nippostrongylus brasiliensis]|uniref:Glyco_transf_41 domain-containing protein n=1 Tax=Nippostrongylus brasiliensis TaxID=27835 RepID=A0A0N4YYM3_NIPBR|nr:unnamed protein product [Nippostrongylus brasiliensis]